MDSVAYLLAYLYGSIPFSYLIPKILTGRDVTKHGDGNVGAMNAYYTTKNPWVFLLCFLLDFSKGFLPAHFFGPVAGAFGVLGHIFSIFMIALKFKFRKFVIGLGMSSTFGLLAVIAPWLIPPALLYFAVFLVLNSPTSLGKWLETEQGNIATVFAVGATVATFFLIGNPAAEVKTAMALVLAGVYIAYAVRIKEQLRKLLRPEIL